MQNGQFFSTQVAASVPYDNTVTDLAAISVQQAIDILAAYHVGLQYAKALVIGSQVIYQSYNPLGSQEGEVLAYDS